MKGIVVNHVINVHILAATPKCLSFAYHMYGSSIGSLSVEQEDGIVINTLWSKNMDMGNQWNYETINVPMLANSKVSFLLHSFRLYAPHRYIGGILILFRLSVCLLVCCQLYLTFNRMRYILHIWHTHTVNDALLNVVTLTVTFDLK